jgi:hypothetical protein
MIVVDFIENSGDSKENAVAILNSEDHMEGVKSEYIYLARKFGTRGSDWKLKRQSLINEGGKRYDKMEIILSDGTEKIIYFDITDFFGKDFY